MIPALVAMNFVERHVNGDTLFKTHIEKIGGMVWLGFGISIFEFLAVVFSLAFKLQTPVIFVICTPVVLSFVGMAQFITACIYRNKMWYAVALVFWAGALTCIFLNASDCMIVFAVCMLLGYAVPGHVLIHKAKKSHV
jgi:hypothetical protein